MTFLIILVSVALLVQVGLFFLIRTRKKQFKNSVIGKYNIKSAGDAWRLMDDLSIPESDISEIEKFYKGEEKED